MWLVTQGGSNGVDSFVESREDMGCAGGVGNAVAVKVGTKVSADTSKNHGDAVIFQLGEQLADGVGGGEVDVGNGAGVHNEPMNLGWVVVSQGMHVVDEAVVVGVEEVRAKTIDDETRLLGR